MKGKRIAMARRTGRRITGKGHRRHNAAEKNERTSRLLFCGIVIALIVAVKSVFPEQVAALAQSASQIIGRNADFVEAFAAVGRAVSGEESVSESLQEAFLAVFNPSQMQSEISDSDPPSGYGDTQSLSVSGTAADEQTEELPQDAAEETDLSGIYTMLSPPENASLEQRNLGFPCTTPVIGTLSSAFGWREHPSEGGTKFHYGIDLAAESGSDIVAFADGEVFAVGESSTLGKYIILLHPGGYKTLYAHCSEVIVKSGSVKMGDVIARVGESGSATGPHLHFELQDGSLYLNPIYYVSIW